MRCSQYTGSLYTRSSSDVFVMPYRLQGKLPICYACSSGSVFCVRSTHVATEHTSNILSGTHQQQLTLDHVKERGVLSSCP